MGWTATKDFFLEVARGNVPGVVGSSPTSPIKTQ